jgi:MFS family permease
MGMAFVAVGHIAFALMDAYWLAAAFMVMVGFGSAMRQASGQGLLLSYADEAYRGRVMALFMTQWSTMQIGALVIGVAAEVIGIRAAFVWLGAALLLLTALVAVLMPHVRRLN